MLLRSLSILPLLLLWTVPAGAVPTEASADPPAQIVAAARQELARRFPGAAARLQVRLVRSGGALDAESVRLVFPEEGALPRAHTQVDVLTRKGQEGWRKTGWALLYVAHYDSVLVTRRRIRGGESLPDGSLQAAWTEITTFRGAPMRPSDLRALRAQGPAVAARALRAGRVLRQTDLRPPYAADTGDTVLMQYRRGPLVLHLSCQAREPGLPGEVIRLYSPDSGSTYRARLTGKGTAEWIGTL